MGDKLLLKWGTVKGWAVETEGFRAALQAYLDAGHQSAGAMTQHDDEKQKNALCAAIDACDGEILNDWSGEAYTKEQAKEYVMGFGKPRTSRAPARDVASPAEIAATREG